MMHFAYEKKNAIVKIIIIKDFLENIFPSKQFKPVTETQGKCDILINDKNSEYILLNIPDEFEVII